MGQSPPSESYNSQGDGLPFLQGKAEFGDWSPRPTKFCRRPLKIAPKGSVLVSVRAPVGDSNIADQDYCIGRGVAALCPNSELDSEFLFAWLLLTKDELNALSSGTTFRSINKNVLEGFPIPHPPIEEQRTIASVLRTVQRAKETCERVIAATRQLKQSLLHHLFTYGPVPFDQADKVPLKEAVTGFVPESWTISRIEAVTLKADNMGPNTKADQLFKYVDVSSVSSETLRITDTTEYLWKDAPSRARKRIRNKDIIFATIRPGIRRIAMVTPELDGQVCSTAFCVLRSDETKIFSTFLFYAVSRDCFVAKVAAREKGSSYPAVTDGVVREQFIPVPRLQVQTEIAAQLAAVDVKLAAAEARRTALDNLFKSLLYHLMTGKVRVNHLVGEPTEAVG